MSNHNQFLHSTFKQLDFTPKFHPFSLLVSLFDFLVMGDWDPRSSEVKPAFLGWASRRFVGLVWRGMGNQKNVGWTVEPCWTRRTVGDLTIRHTVMRCGGNIQQVKNRKGPPKMGLHFMNAKGLKQQETLNNGNFPEMDVQPFWIIKRDTTRTCTDSKQLVEFE